MPNTDADIRLPLTSADVLGEREERLKELFPEAFVEGQIDFDRLRNALGDFVGEGRERYGLSWAGRADAIRAIQAPSVGTLVPCPDESVNFDTTENLFIEGDNLEVLKLLQKSYYGKVKMIYIDPPFNTGNDLIYPDNFREGLEDYLKYSGQMSDAGMRLTTSTETAGRYHSKWLSMMYPRLFLARNLLSNNGVIFVSIDDHELANLRLLMDELFGEEQFIAVLVWKSRHNVDSRNKTGVSSDHEYVLAYGRKLRGQSVDEEKYSNPDNEPRGPWMSDNMVGLATKAQRPNLHYELTNPETGLTYECPPKGWRYDRTTMAQKISEKRVLWPASPDGRPRHKKFLNELKSRFTGFSSLLQVPTTAVGTQETRELVGEGIFDFPKPRDLLKTLVEQATEDDSLVLDFFAGSGTTGDAVIHANLADAGNRRFILVQLPEPTNTDSPAYLRGLKTIADIAKERLRALHKKLTRDANGNLEYQTEADSGFRTLKLTSSNFKIWNANSEANAETLQDQLQLFANHMLRDRSEQDVLHELMLKAGLQLTVAIEEANVAGHKVYSIAEGLLAICLANPISKECLRGIISLEPQRVICLDAAFGGNDQLKTNTVLEMKSHGIEFRTV